MMPDSNWFYKIIAVRNQKLLGINGSSLLPGEWVYQNDDAGDPAQEWAFQLVDPTNNTYRIYNRNSRLLMKWTETASQRKDNSGNLFQDNPDCSSKYEIFGLIQSDVSGSCMLTLDTANMTSYVTASAYCWMVKNRPAEGFPFLGNLYSGCQYFMLQKTGNTIYSIQQNRHSLQDRFIVAFHKLNNALSLHFSQCCISVQFIYPANLN